MIHIKHLQISTIMLLMAISTSLAYALDLETVGEGLFIDGEGYIGPFLENASGTGSFIGNLSSNNTSISNSTSNGSENGSEIGEGLFIDDEGYIGPYLANLSNHSSRNASNISTSLNAYESGEAMPYPKPDRERLIRDLGFENSPFGDLQGFTGHFGSLAIGDFFDGRRFSH